MQHRAGVAEGDSADQIRTPRALVANDQEIWIWSLETILAPNGFAVSRATSAAQVIEQIQAGPPDVLIIHATLRDRAGIDLCQELRERQLLSDATPIVVTATGPCRRHDRLRVLRSGGWDYSSLPLDAEELIAKLRTFLGAKFSYDRASADSLIDPATGFYDIQGILRRVQEMGLVARRHARALGCASVSYGEASLAMNDFVTASPRGGGAPTERERASSVLRSVVRGSDIVGRVGRNEFVILAPETEIPGVTRLANRLVEAFELESRTSGDPLPVRVGCYAVPDFAATHIEPVEVIVRATHALRLAELPDASPVQLFGNGA